MRERILICFGIEREKDTLSLKFWEENVIILFDNFTLLEQIRNEKLIKFSRIEKTERYYSSSVVLFKSN